MKSARLIRKLAALALILALTAAACAQGLFARDYDPESPWTGNWASRWRGGGARIELRQTGNTVEGVYPLYNGTIQGTVVGNTLTGTWQERQVQTRSGQFMFTLAKDGRSFSGQFDSGEWWNGERVAPQAETEVIEADLSSPREVLRSFLIAGAEVRAGNHDSLARMLQCVNFEDEGIHALLGEKAELVGRLFECIDLCTLRLWELPGEGVTSETVRLTFRQPGPETSFTVRLDQGDGRWRLRMPARGELEQSLALLRGDGRSDRDPLAYRDLRTPRDTFRFFLTTMAARDREAPLRAARALDLSGVPEAVRDVEARILTEQLKHVLDRISLIVLQEIPNDPESRVPYTHYSHPRGEVVVGPVTQEGQTRWVFTRGTLRSLQDLYESLESAPTAPGVTAHQTMSISLRMRNAIASVSPRLLDRPLVLANWQWPALAVLVVAAYFVGRLMSRLLAWTLDRKLLRQRYGGVRKDVVKSLHPARLFFAGMVCYAGVAAIGLPSAALKVVLTSIWVISLVAAVAAAFRFSVVVFAQLREHAKGTARFYDDIMFTMIGGIVKVVIVIAGIILVAESLNIPYRGMLAGLGIGGIAVAIAAKDMLANFFGSAALLIDRPFRKGDYLNFGEVHGEVEEVGLRSTRVRTFDDSLVVVPNSHLATIVLNNMGTRRFRRQRMALGVRYDTSPDKLDDFCRRLRRTLMENEHIISERVQVEALEFGDSAIRIDLMFHFANATFQVEREQRHAITLAIMEIAEEMGVEFAFPTRTVVFDAQPPGADAGAAKS